MGQRLRLPRRWWLASQPPRIQAYVVGSVVLAFVVTTTVVIQGGVHQGFAWRDVLLWCVLAISTSWCTRRVLQLHVAEETDQDLTAVWTLSALLLWGPAEAFVITLAVTGLWTPIIDRNWADWRPKLAQRMLTLSGEMVAVGLGAIVLRQSGHGGPGTLWQLLAIAMFLAADAAIVLGIVRIATGADLLALIKPWSTRVMLLTEGTLSIGVAAAWHTSHLAAILLCGTLVAAGAGLHYAQLMEKANTDQRTGLLRAASWSETVERLLTREPVGVLLGDLDHFKLVNDRHGHLTGDAVLARVGEAISAQLRPGDLAGRWGGEEFVIALPGVDREGALAGARRLIEAIRALEHDASDGSTFRCTMSIGVALAHPCVAGEEAATLREAVDLADAAMYVAKGRGRDRVVLSGESTERELQLDFGPEVEAQLKAQSKPAAPAPAGGWNESTAPRRERLLDGPTELVSEGNSATVDLRDVVPSMERMRQDTSHTGERS